MTNGTKGVNEKPEIKKPQVDNVAKSSCGCGCGCALPLKKK